MFKYDFMRCLPIILVFVFTAFSVSAQKTTSARGTAQIGKSNEPKAEQYANAETLSVDFKSFTFPNFAVTGKKTFTLKNGSFNYANAKTAEFYNFQLRKVFYFDMTGDEKTEAVAHILAAMCEDCSTRSAFYLYSAEKKQPKEIWKIALGAAEKCGLKEVQFDKSEVVLDAFGDCALKDWSILNEPKSKKSDIFTRFVFNRKNGEFIQISKEVFPFPAKDIPTYRSQIKFGSVS